MTQRLSAIAGLAALAALSACTIGGGVYSPAPTSPTAPPPAPAPPPRPADTTPSDPRAQTVTAMLDSARSARISGNLVQAESTLEAALRISPSDAQLWLEMARVQFANGEFDAARNFADRAASLAGDNEQIRRAAADIRALSAQ